MDWLNYHHLLYFWTIAREGSIARACERLLLAQPTLSGQLRALEQAVGAKLFDRVGRRLVLTDVGQTVYRYADEMFTLGRELQDVLRDQPVGRPLRLNVGLVDVLPKLVAYRLLEPALRMPEKVHVICRDGRPEALLTELAMHEHDVVLSDSPAGTATQVRVYNHLLGECGVTIFATAAMTKKLRRNFPQSLKGTPFLLPVTGTTLRRSLDQWCDDQGLRLEIRGEFADSALLKAFGQSGLGAFAAPSIIEREVCRQHGVRVVGKIDSIQERFYAVSAERKLKHPAVVALSAAAKQEIFRDE